MTRASIEARNATRDRLMKVIALYDSEDATTKNILSVAKWALEINEIGSEGPPEEIAEMIKSMLLPVSMVFTENYFRQPAFATRVLKDVANLYECLPMSGEMVSAVDAKSQIDSIAMSHAWLASVLLPTVEMVRNVITRYQRSQKLDASSPSSLPSNNTPDPIAVLPLATASALALAENRGRFGITGSDGLNNELNETGVGGGNVQRQARNGTDSGPTSAPTAEPPSFIRDKPMSFPADTTRKASAVQNYFKDGKFSGDRDPETLQMRSIRNVIRDYDVCAMQQALRPKQKAEYFINVFSGSARDFFFDNCTTSMNYIELVQVMLSEYDSDARQLEAQSELEMLSIEKIMREEDVTSLNVGLDRLVTRVNNLTPQCPEQFRSEKHKVRYLRAAVLKQKWAEAGLSQITTAKFTYNRFVTALREQLQFHQERHGKDISVDKPVFYQQYGRRPITSKFRKAKPSTGYSPNKNGLRKNPFDRNGKRMLCHECGSEDHLARFHKTSGITEYVRDRLGKGNPAVHVVHDLVTKMERMYLEPDEICEDADPDSQEPDETHVVESRSSPIYELSEFDRLTSEAAVQVGVFDEIDGTNAVNHIASTMGSDVPRSQITRVYWADDKKDF